jgi:hypothetical protein
MGIASEADRQRVGASKQASMHPFKKKKKHACMRLIGTARHVTVSALAHCTRIIIYSIH